MHVVKTTKAKKGGKSRSKATLAKFDEKKTQAVNMVMRNVVDEARKIEMQAVKQILEKHLGRDLIQSDAQKVGRIALPNGYVLTYENKPLGEIERHNHTDPKAEQNYKITFTPYENEHSEATT